MLRCVELDGCACLLLPQGSLQSYLQCVQATQPCSHHELQKAEAQKLVTLCQVSTALPFYSHEALHVQSLFLTLSTCILAWEAPAVVRELLHV